VTSLGSYEISLYENNGGQFFYQPLIIPDWNRYSISLKETCASIAQEDTRQLSLKVVFMDDVIENDLLTQLNSQGKTASRQNLNPLPHTIFQIFVDFGNRTTLISDKFLPPQNSGIGVQVNPQLPPYTYFEVEGTCAELESLYNRRQYDDTVSGQLFSQGFDFSSDFISASAKFANNQLIRSDLFGDETLEDRVVTSTKSKGGGWNVNLGVVKFGGGGGSTSISTSQGRQRIVSRDFITNTVSKYQADLTLFVQGNPERTQKIVEQFTNMLLGLMTSVEMEITVDNQGQWSLVNGALGYVNLVILDVKELQSTAPQLTNTSEDSTSVTANGATASQTKKGDFTYKNDVRWEFDGEKWIPTKVDLYILTEDSFDKAITFQAQFFNEDGNRATASAFAYPGAYLYEREFQIANANLEARVADLEQSQLKKLTGTVSFVVPSASGVKLGNVSTLIKEDCITFTPPFSEKPDVVLTPWHFDFVSDPNDDPVGLTYQVAPHAITETGFCYRALGAYSTVNGLSFSWLAVGK
jgi:hypothetical protein